MGEKNRDEVTPSGETSVLTEHGSAEEINAIGDNLFAIRLKALHAASEHIGKLESAHRLEPDERIRLETKLASFLSGDEQHGISVGASFFAPLGGPMIAARAASDGPDQG